jgi:hypothetical protein
LTVRDRCDRREQSGDRGEGGNEYDPGSGADGTSASTTGKRTVSHGRLPNDHYRTREYLHLLGLQPTELLAPPIIRHPAHPDLRIASTMFWPCETKTSTCRNFATIASGLYRFLAITVLLDVKNMLQVGPLQWGRITPGSRTQALPLLSAAFTSIPAIPSTFHSKAFTERRHIVELPGYVAGGQATNDGFPVKKGRGRLKSAGRKRFSIWLTIGSTIVDKYSTEQPQRPSIASPLIVHTQ